MQLTYRGTQYNIAPAFTTTVDSGMTATYRGVNYSVMKSNAVATLPTKALKYRGVVIGEPEASFFPAPGAMTA
ncbi:DUF4278 domain-containing protein [Egbenema bharatensis]|uniref:DUF4278 domain-containing protein n=1 Tax=Egbenema bharatensis TaxID=3463334 RepID=UPI003A8BC940